MSSDDCETNPNYWDCECKENNIHPKYEAYCPYCGCHSEDQPDSRKTEVQAAGLPPHTNFCNRCGDSVIPGSGKFTNRVPDLNSIQMKIDSNRPYPVGAYICAECDAKTSDTVDADDIMVCPHCKKTITYLDTVTRGTCCEISLEPRKECADPDIEYFCYECGNEILPKDIPGHDMYEL